MKPFIYFITGASGAGKTALVEALALDPDCQDTKFLHFDSVGVPEEIPEDWQQKTTQAWVTRMLSGEFSEFSRIVIEGQVDPNFIEVAFAGHEFNNYQIILLDASMETLFSRLNEQRQQPELATEDMENWANYLRRVAKDKQLAVVFNDGSLVSTLEKWKQLL